MKKNLKFILLALFLVALVYAGCTYEYSMDPYHGKVNPNGAKVDTTGVTEYEGISISNSFLPVTFDGTERKVLEADTVNGHFVMKADDETLKKLGIGSVVAFDTDSLMYLRKVTGISIENGVAEMETEKANPFELIKEGRFGFAIDGKSKVMTRSSAGFDDGRDYPVFRPVEMRYKDEDGKWHRQRYSNHATRAEEGAEWNEDDEIEGEGKDHHGSIALDHTEKKFSFPFSFSSFDGTSVETEVAIEYTHGSKETSDINMVFDISLFGASQVQVYKEYNTWDTTKLAITIKGGSSLPNKVNDKLDNLKEVLHLDHSFTLLTIVFMVGPLPIVIDIEFNPELTVSLAVNGSLTMEYQSIQIKEGMKSGLDFRSDAGVDRISDPGKTVKTEGNLTKYIVQGQGAFKISFTPQFKFMIWGFVGPYIGVEAYNESSISVGHGWNVEAGERYVLPEDYTDVMAGGYQFKNEVGLNLIAGLDLDFLRKLLPSSWNPEQIKLGFQYPIINPQTLFEAPSSLRCNNNIYDINIGKQNEIEFQVMSKLFGKNIPFNLPYFVRVESTGNELLYSEKNEYNEEYDDDDMGFSMNTNMLSGFSSLGMSKYNVIWTPASLDSKLIAYIMGPDGDELSSVILKPSNVAENCTPIDMGTSCLWAPMNVGAKQIQDRGDYVGWGDPTGKHKEQGAYSSADGTSEADDEVLKSYYGGKKAAGNISASSRDYATAKWGGSWRIPTKEEWQELIDKCDWVWNEEYKCYEITSRSTGEKLVLPANGYRIGTEYSDVGRHLNYWSSNLYYGTSDRMEAYYFSGRPHRSESRRLNANYHTPRYFGQGVRPVMNRRDYNEYDFSE